jgi:hypothetical protein
MLLVQPATAQEAAPRTLGDAPAMSSQRWLDRFLDPEDGAFDLSDHLLTHRGVLPVPIIITEPALGYGGGIAGLWFRESIGEAGARGLAESGRRAPPAIGALAGFKTENGSSGGFAGFFTPLAGDRYRVLGGAGRVGLDLDYYDRNGRPAAYTLDGEGLLVQALARVGDSDFLIGLRYAWIDTQSAFQRERALEIPQRDLDVRLGRLSLIVDYDSRDNLFTPGRGTYVEAELATASEALGGTVQFRSFFIRGFHYVPVGEVVIGLRADFRATSDGTPFFAKPYVSLRGIPALRYQDHRVAVVETELRWNVTRRWALLGFVGAGKAYGGRADWSEAESPVAKGVGFRYMVARKLGLYVGLDAARGPEDRAIYIQVGSAWM